MNTFFRSSINLFLIAPFGNGRRPGSPRDEESEYASFFLLARQVFIRALSWKKEGWTHSSWTRRQLLVLQLRLAPLARAAAIFPLNLPLSLPLRNCPFDETSAGFGSGVIEYCQTIATRPSERCFDN